MSYDNHPAIARNESTDIRFSIRTVLILMGCAAVLAAIAGPHVRGLQADRQLRMFVGCGAWLAMVVVWIVVAARRRMHVERLTGTVILRLPIYGTAYRWRRIHSYMLSMALASCGLGGLYLVADRAIDARSMSRALASPFSLTGILSALLAAQGAALWWWSDHARLSEAGLLWDRRLISWSQANCWWDSEREVLTFKGLDQQGATLQCEVVVPVALREFIETVLQERLPGSPEAAARSSIQQARQ